MAELIDLHTHSTASDGSFSPREVVELAKKQGLKALALTDHDTLSGLFEAEEKAKELDMEFVRGCELSAKFLDTDVHVFRALSSERQQFIGRLGKRTRYFH